MKQEIVIVGFSRTPFGSFQGSLSSLSASDLGAKAIEGALKKAGLAADAVSDVIMGHVITGGSGQAPARQAMIKAGIPSSSSALTINKVCGSGMKAIMLGAQGLMMDSSKVFVVGGQESMTNAPYVMPQARSGFRMGSSQVLDSMIHDGLWDPYHSQHMGNCGDLCAKEKSITREEQDHFATESFRRAQAAQASGVLKNEITAIEIKGSKGDSVWVEKDEGPEKVKFEKIPTLKPVFSKDGTITPANASTINDGAAALVLMTREEAEKRGLKPLAKILDFSEFSADPIWFTTAPVGAKEKLLKKLNWSVSDVDLFEINEAFAVVPLYSMKAMKIPHEKVNVHGGAISIGHPLGASGARIVISLLNALNAKGLKRGVASICIGGGEATVIAIEVCK